MFSLKTVWLIGFSNSIITIMSSGDTSSNYGHKINSNNKWCLLDHLDKLIQWWRDLTLTLTWNFDILCKFCHLRSFTLEVWCMYVCTVAMLFLLFQSRDKGRLKKYRIKKKLVFLVGRSCTHYLHVKFTLTTTAFVGFCFL